MATTAEKADEILDDKLLAEEELLDELEKDDIPAHIRDARMKQFKQMSKDLNDMKLNQHGDYSDILEEKQFLDITIAEERCIVHFYHTDFRRCAIMDSHLKALAKKHFESRFIKINAEKAKFFVTKLNVYILPTVLCFKKGVVVDRLIGFDELGNIDDFNTDTLENRLMKSGVVYGKPKDNNSIFGFAKGKKNKSEDDSSDDDN